jgi:hypothetical protein
MNDIDRINDRINALETNIKTVVEGLYTRIAALEVAGAMQRARAQAPAGSGLAGAPADVPGWPYGTRVRISYGSVGKDAYGVVVPRPAGSTVVSPASATEPNVVYVWVLWDGESYPGGWYPSQLEVVPCR